MDFGQLPCCVEICIFVVDLSVKSNGSTITMLYETSSPNEIRKM